MRFPVLGKQMIMCAVRQPLRDSEGGGLLDILYSNTSSPKFYLLRWLLSEGGVLTFEGRGRVLVLSTGRSATTGDKDVDRYEEDREGRCRSTIASHRVSNSPSDGCLRTGTHRVGCGAKRRRTLDRSKTSRSEYKEHPSSLNSCPRIRLQMRKISG